MVNMGRRVLAAAAAMSLVAIAFAAAEVKTDSAPDGGAAAKPATQPATRPGVGRFEAQADVGKIEHPGSAEYIAERGEYHVSAAGENIWGRQDAFHFLWRKTSGDLTFSADIHFTGEGKNKHRKACLMIRQSLDPGAAYADVAVHGDGLVSLQYRPTAGGPTQEVQSSVKGPAAAVRLERRGERFTLWVTPKGEAPREVGSATVKLQEPVYAGLAVSSHEADAVETAVFSDVQLTPSDRGAGANARGDDQASGAQAPHIEGPAR